MDTSKEYIKMCEKAGEIQRYMEGIFGYGKKPYKNNKIPYPCAWVYAEGKVCPKCELYKNTTARRIKIKIIEVLREWAEEHGFETSAEMEADDASRICDKLEEEFKEE